jgi:molybdopterin-guanine dinucleotide biosynthesis protein A
VRDVAALILAGGKATRFGGIAKHALVVAGKTIFERQVAVLAPRVDEIIVSGVEIAGYRTVLDELGSGPLAGIHAGLGAVREWLLVVAGDMPFITGELIDSLIDARSPELDAVAFRVDDRPEPLCSLLHVRTRAAVERRLVGGLYKASGLFTDEGLRVRWLTHADPEALRNLNSPSDLPG